MADVQEAINSVITKVIETQDEFVFTTIYPFIQQRMQCTITKDELIDRLRNSRLARLLTEDEIKAKKPFTVWVEDAVVDDGEPFPVALMMVGGELVYKDTYGNYWIYLQANDDDYGKTWRCWSDRPTEQQRKETAWECQ